MKSPGLPLPSEKCLPDLYGAAMTGRLAKDYFHQIGNCLFGIMGYTEVLLSQIPDDDPQKRRVRMVEEQALNLKRLVDALSEFSGRKESAPELTDIQGLLQGVGRLLRNIAVKAGVTVEEDYQELPLLMVDGARLKQAVCYLLHFLITNNPDRSVLVSTRQKSGHAEIRISGDAGEKKDGGPLSDPCLEHAERLTMKNLPVHLSRLKAEELGGRLEAICEGDTITFTISLPTDQVDRLKAEG